MAKASVNTSAVASQIVSAVRSGSFSPVYLLMGEEAYYVDMVCDEIIANALQESERDFNQLICYGPDVTAEDVISNARRYPMFAERQLVVLKEAQQMKGIDQLSVYTDAPLDTTVFVIVYRGSLDKRKALYKSIGKSGVVLESQPLRDYEVPRWIVEFYASKGLQIDPDAAALLAESAGTDLNKISIETEKLLKNLPEGCTRVGYKDIEQNVGISREFSIFELTRQLSFKDSRAALRTATYIANSAKFAMPMATAALYTHFSRILKYHALRLQNPRPDNAQVASLLGVNPFFLKEYDTALRNYSLQAAMAAIGLLRDYDFKGKGGDQGEATAAELMMELVTKILNLR